MKKEIIFPLNGTQIKSIQKIKRFRTEADVLITKAIEESKTFIEKLLSIDSEIIIDEDEIDTDNVPTIPYLTGDGELHSLIFTGLKLIKGQIHICAYDLENDETYSESINEPYPLSYLEADILLIIIDILENYEIVKFQGE